MPKFALDALQEAKSYSYYYLGGWLIQYADAYWATDDEDVARMLVMYLTGGDVERAQKVLDHPDHPEDEIVVIDMEYIERAVGPNPAGSKPIDIFIKYVDDVAALVGSARSLLGSSLERITFACRDLDQRASKVARVECLIPVVRALKDAP